MSLGFCEAKWPTGQEGNRNNCLRQSLYHKYRIDFHWCSPIGTKRQGSALTFLIQFLCGPSKAAILPCKTGLDVVVPVGLKLGVWSRQSGNHNDCFRQSLYHILQAENRGIFAIYKKLTRRKNLFGIEMTVQNLFTISPKKGLEIIGKRATIVYS